MRRLLLATVFAAALTAAPAQAQWRSLQPSPLARTEVGAARVGFAIYVVGGFEETTGQTTNGVARYDLNTSSWTLVRPLPIAVNHAAVTSDRRYMYVTGGYTAPRDFNRRTAALFRYDPRVDRWKRLRDAPTARAAHTMQAIGHKLYVVGGVDASGATRRMEVYDTRRNRWVRGPAMPTAREHLASAIAFVPNRPRHRLYVLGGRTAEAGNLTTVESYDPETRRWRREPPMRKARGGFAAAPVDGLHFAVFGGEEASGTIAAVEQFDVAKRHWSALPDMTTPRHGLGGVDFRRQIFALEGGPQPGFAFSNAAEVLSVP
jgi:hypothetical protein